MKEKSKSWIMVVFSVLVAAVLIIGPNTSAEAATKHLKIGVIMPISGPISVVGMALSRGFEICFDKVNERGGLKVGADRYIIDLIVEDSKLSPDGAGAAARKLVHKDGAKFVIGAILSQSAVAIYQVCAPAKALHVISWLDVPTHPGDVSPQKPFAVRVAISSDVMYEMDYDYLKQTYPKSKRVVVVAPDGGYERMIERATEVAKTRGIDIVGVEMWPMGTSDFLPVYTKALSHKPHAIHAMVSAQANYQLRAARQLGFTGPFFSDSPLGPDVILRTAGPDASHDVFCNGMDINHATPVMKDVMSRWQKKYNEPFVSDTLMAYDMGWILVQGIEKAGSVDPTKVVKMFDSLTAPGSLKTSFGPGSMGGFQRFGVNRVLTRSLPISRLRQGKIEFVGFKTPIIQ
ncbi:MAG: ABC transporter substrate-binding protein [Desulfobacterales bacterium]|jgi:branched-chain amino acid transport system substrate-binding protein|nr:ABC transporter substrate-binding protein [Desulfobacterales bacterium]MDP6808488.1 ABC transporter substrate-binding protein [Desulfobacterales bacterium]|tara:strand:+ start:23994 stop:25202 length:1209 start_codon:yes stop_codon:yes gene_type:complete